eukprot:25909_1
MKISNTTILILLVSIFIGAILALIWMFSLTDMISITSIYDKLRGITGMNSSIAINDVSIMNSDNTLENYNNELFCPIKNKTGYKSGMYRLLHDINKLQYLDNCSDINNHFWIYTHSCQGIGLFAMLNCWSFYFTQAFVLKRTFLFSGTFYNYAPKEFCNELG